MCGLINIPGQMTVGSFPMLKYHPLVFFTPIVPYILDLSHLFCLAGFASPTWTFGCIGLTTSTVPSAKEGAGVAVPPKAVK